VYWRIGQPVEAGNNLLIDEIHDPKKVIPLRMAPLILLATVASHLFGASVGREGTAVQMGGALADQLTRPCHLDRTERRILLMAGISAGFASVFGTPLAGAVFALEVLAIGRLRYEALLPCLFAALLADQVTLAWGIHHSHYPVVAVPAWSVKLGLGLLLAGAVFGWVGKAFAEATHGVSAWIKSKVSYPPLRPVLGGLVVLVLSLWLPLEPYLGLGLLKIEAAFQNPVFSYDFAAKWGLTVWCLGSGFKGGEVTPLFFIGATLGNSLAPLLDIPFLLLAALGFVAVFAGAANTPLACTLMAVELFGGDVAVPAMLTCVMSYLCSGHSSIYRAQRIGHGKHRSVAEGLRVAELPQIAGQRPVSHKVEK
jgi:H+/Cl- antiporter ClcA